MAKGRAEKPAKEEVVHNSPVEWERAFKLAWEDLSPKEKNIFVALFGDIDSFLFAVRNSGEDVGTQRALTTIFEAMKNHKIDELYREFEQAIVKNPRLPPAKIIKNVLGGEFIPRGLLAFIQSYKSSLHLPASLEIALRRAGMLNKVGKAYKVSNLDTRQFVNFFEWLITAERRGIRGDVEVTPEGLLWISADKTVVLLVRTNPHLTESYSLDLASIADVLASDSLSKRFVEDLHRAWFYMLFDKGGHFIGIAILSGNNAYIVSAEPLELRLELPRPNLNDMSNLRIDGNDIKVVTRYLRYKPAIFVSTHLGRGEKGFVADIWKTKKGYNVKEFEVGVVATPRESALYSTALSWVAGEVMRWWQGVGGVAIYSKGWFNHTYIFPVASYGALGDDFMIYATPDVSVEEFVRERWFAKKPKAEGAEKPAKELDELRKRVLNYWEKYGVLDTSSGIFKVAYQVLEAMGRTNWVKSAYQVAKGILPCITDECEPIGKKILHELIVEAIKPETTKEDLYNTAKILAKQYKRELEREHLLKSGGELVLGGLVRVVLYQEGLYPPDMLDRYLNEFFEQAEKHICRSVRPNGGICYAEYLEEYGNPTEADDALNADIRNFEMEGSWGKQIADLLRLSREVYYAKNLPLKDKILLFDKVVHAEHLSGSIFGDVDVPMAKKKADKIVEELERKLPALLRMARNYPSPEEFAKAFGIVTADIKLHDLKDRLRARKKELMDFNKTQEAKEVARLERMLPEAPLTLREVWEIAKFGEAEKPTGERPSAKPRKEPIMADKVILIDALAKEVINRVAKVVAKRTGDANPILDKDKERSDTEYKIWWMLKPKKGAKDTAFANVIYVEVGMYEDEGEWKPYVMANVPQSPHQCFRGFSEPLTWDDVKNRRDEIAKSVAEYVWGWFDCVQEFEELKRAGQSIIEEIKAPAKERPPEKPQPEPTPQEESLRFIRTKLANAYEAEMKLQGFPGERAPAELIDDLARKVYAGELQQVEAMVKVLSEAKKRAADLKLGRAPGVKVEKAREVEEVTKVEKPTKAGDTYERLLVSLDKRLMKRNIVLEDVLPTIDNDLKRLAEEVELGTMTFDEALIQASRLAINARMRMKKKGEAVPFVEIIGEEPKVITATEVLEKRRKERKEMPSHVYEYVGKIPEWLKGELKDPEVIAEILLNGVNQWLAEAKQRHPDAELYADFVARWVDDHYVYTTVQTLKRRLEANPTWGDAVALYILDNYGGKLIQGGYREAYKGWGWLKAWLGKQAGMGDPYSKDFLKHAGYKICMKTDPVSGTVLRAELSPKCDKELTTRFTLPEMLFIMAVVKVLEANGSDYTALPFPFRQAYEVFRQNSYRIFRSV